MSVTRLKARLLLVGVMVVMFGSPLTGITTDPVPVFQPSDEPLQGAGSKAESPRKATPAHTDRYGDPLPEEAAVRLGTVRLRHGAYVLNVAFTADGKQLVSHGNNGVRIWDVATGKELRSVMETWLSSAAISADGKFLITCEMPLNRPVVRLRRWSDLSGAQEFSVPGFNSTRFSPDAKVLAIATHRPGEIQLWDVPSDRNLHTLNAYRGTTMPCFTFSDDGKTLVTGGSDKIIRLWDVETGKKKREFVTPAIVTQALISRDGTLVASLGMIEEKTGNTTRTYRSENTIRLWDVASGKELRQLVNPSKAGFHILALAPDGRTVVTVAGDGVLRFWDPGTGKEKRRLDLGKIPPTSLAFSPDGKTLALGGHAIRLIDSATGNDRIKLHGQQSLVSAAAFVLDGRTAVTTFCNQTISLWNARTGEELGSFQGVEEWAGNASFLDRGQFLFANGPDKTIRVYDLAAKKEVRRFKPPPHHSQLQAISPDGRVLAMTGKGKGVTLVNLESVKESRLLQENEVDITGVAFGTLGRTLIVWYADHTAQVWDLPSEKSVKRIELGDKADIGMALAIAGGRFAYLGYSAAVSPDGRYLAYASPKRSLLLYELPAGRLIRRSVELPSDISILAFSPDDRTIAWAGHDSVIHLMETASFRERHQFKGHQGVIYSLAFSPDGRSLISGSEDTTALIWDLTGKLANERSGPLSAVELESCWSDLAGQDAAKAYDTIRRLSIFPAIAGPDLAKRLQPVPVIDVRRLSSLVADLDANQFAVREAAEKQLERLGEVAAPVCRKAMEAKPSTETRRRLAALIEKQSKEEMNLPPNRLRNVRAVEILENIDTREARELLAQLARGAEEAGLTKEANLSLERIVKRSSVAP